MVRELRISVNQEVKKDEIIAVLSNYPQAEFWVRQAEAELETAQRSRATFDRASEIGL